MTETGKTYNGWTNYETWDVALWIDNEQPSYTYWRDTARELMAEFQDGAANTKGDQDNAKESAARVLAERLKDEIEEGNPLSDSASMYSDILGAALQDVNWDEIATNWIDEVYESPAPEPEEDDDTDED